jgi:hypothetical protein
MIRQFSLLVFVIQSICLLGQYENYNIKVVGRSMYWEKIYEIPDDMKQVVVLNHSLSAMIDTTVIFPIEGDLINISKHGISRYSVRAMATEPFRYTVKLSIKDKRYRVQVYNMVTTMKNLINPLISNDIFFDNDIKKDGTIKTGNLMNKHLYALDKHMEEKYGLRYESNW